MRTILILQRLKLIYERKTSMVVDEEPLAHDIIIKYAENSN
ncbi:MAG: hypothetical protein WBA74_00340 [Cyclobacteriaceae bacterium]